MAKIKMGMWMTDARGKSGGHVISKNRGGSYVRTKVTPVNPRTAAQTAIRSAFAAISSAWSSLSNSARESFNGFVTSYATTDIFGDLRNPSGKALFQKLNLNLVISGQPQITNCVSPLAVPALEVEESLFNSTSGTANLKTNGDVTNNKVIIWATPPLSQGTKFVKNRLRQITIINGGNGLVYDFGAAYLLKFGAAAPGSNIYVGGRVINTNGQASPLEVVKATVV